MEKNTKKQVILQFKAYLKHLLLTLMFTIAPAFVCAQGLNDDNSDNLTMVLTGLEQLLTGTYARSIMIIAIAGIGYLWLWKGSIPANRAMSAIIGIGIVFSAGYLYSQLGIGN